MTDTTESCNQPPGVLRPTSTDGTTGASRRCNRPLACYDGHHLELQPATVARFDPRQDATTTMSGVAIRMLGRAELQAQRCGALSSLAAGMGMEAAAKHSVVHGEREARGEVGWLPLAYHVVLKATDRVLTWSTDAKHCPFFSWYS